MKYFFLKSFSIIAIFSFLLSSCKSKDEPQQPITENSKWILKWEDNFDAATINYSVWTKIPRALNPWNRYMSYYDSCYGIKNGNLILRGIKNVTQTHDTAQYLTGGIYTKDNKHFGYGRLEIRAKLNGAKGAWPAFWMLPEKGEWPHAGEIDIMEHLNFDSIVYQTVHSHYTYNLGIENNPISGVKAAINPNDYNVYALEKYPDSLVFYVNDKRTFAYPRIKTDKPGQYPFDDYKYYLLLDMQLGGSNWVGPIDPADLPVEIFIDWVRFYELRN